MRYEKLESETKSDRNFEYGVALKAKGFGYVTLEVPALGIAKGSSIRKVTILML